MPKHSKKAIAPRLCERTCRSTGRPLAYATFNGRYISFGPAGPEATRRYEEFLARWLANGRLLDAPADAAPYLVEDLVADFLEHARSFYVDPTTGKPNGEYVNLRAVLLGGKRGDEGLAAAPSVVDLFGKMPAHEFGPLALRAVRESMVECGRLCRKEINARVHRIRRAWRWAASMEKVPAAAVQALASVDGLRQGKTVARESEPVRPVEEDCVREVVAHLCPTVAAMVWFGFWTGARPGEVCALRWSVIDRSGPVWIAELEHHKTAWRGRRRRIAIGPQAQKVLVPFLRPGPDRFVFSARDAVLEQRSAKAARRRTKVPPSQEARAARSSAKSRREVAECYDVAAYRRAIERGVRLANAARIRSQLAATVAALAPNLRPARAERLAHLSAAALTDARGRARVRELLLLEILGDAAGAGDVVRQVVADCGEVALLENWAPNRLRHSAATRLRREEGLEAARVVLGHSRAAVTEIYAEVDFGKSLDIMRRLG